MRKTVASRSVFLSDASVALSHTSSLTMIRKVGGVATGLVAAYALGMFSSKGPDTAENRHIQGNGKKYKYFDDVSGATPQYHSKVALGEVCVFPASRALRPSFVRRVDVPEASMHICG